MKKFSFKDNKLLIAISSLSVITLIVIIYAAFTGQLNINGTANVRDSKWDIHIVESGQLEPSNTLSSSAKVLTKPTASNLSISDFNLSLTTPGDYIEYTFHVVNDGDYDATLSDLDKAGVTCTANGSTSDSEAVKVCEKLEYTLKYDNGSDVAEGDTILSKQTQTMVLTIKYQEFDDPFLLPTTNVSISGLGIDISYSQNGSAKVNPDGTTPYVVPTYSVGDTITLAGEQYYVIADSDSTKDYVTVLKANPLTATEINTYGVGHVNMYNATLGDSTYHTAYDWNDANHTGGMAYYSSPTCGYNGSSWIYDGCTNDYATSEVKYVIDAWSQAKFTNGELKTVDGYGARLITFDEAHSFGYGDEPQSPCGPSCGVIYYPKTDAVPSWIYNSKYWYWTMSPYNNSALYVWYVNIAGSLGNDLSVFDGSDAVRPVLNIYKSKI